MKKYLLLLLFVLPLFIHAQSIDTAAVAGQIKELIKVSKKLYTSGDFETALQKQDEAEKLTLDNFGWDAAGMPNLILNRANILQEKGDYKESEKWYNKALELQEKLTGKEHVDYAYILNNLAFLYYSIGQYEKAEEYHIVTKNIWEKLLGKEHTEYSQSLNNLAIVYLTTGAYELAEPLCIETIELRKKIVGIEHPLYCGSLINLAYLYIQLAEYEKSEKLLLEAKDIFENKIENTQHPFYVNCIGNLSSLYTDLGNYEKAEPLSIQTMEMFEKLVGKTHPQYARAQTGLSKMYQQTGRFDEAEKLLQDALSIRENTFGKSHREYAEALVYLGNLNLAKNDLDPANNYLSEAENFIEEILGKEHVDYANVQAKIGDLHLAKGDFILAEKYYQTATEIYETISGKDNAQYVRNLFNRGLCYAHSSQHEKAVTVFDEASKLTQTVLTKSMHHLSEKELNIYLNTFSDRQDKMLSFALKNNNEKIAQLCYDNSLFYKGFLLNAVNQTKRLALSNPETAKEYLKLQGLERRLSEIYAQPISERDNDLIESLEQNVDELEKALTRSVAGFSDNNRQVNWQEVRRSLKPGEAALEFVHFDFHEKEKSDKKYYAAILLKSTQHAPKFIQLFEEKSLDSLLLLHQDRRSDYVNDLYAFEERGAAVVGKPKSTLYDLIWSPIEGELEEVTTVYFSPAGLLHRINLNAIPLDEDISLSDRYKLIQLNSTRQLTLQELGKNAGQTAVLYGGIQYEMDSLFLTENMIDLSDALTSRSIQTNPSNLRGGSWNYLRWTQKEVESVADELTSHQYNVQLLSGYSATEESFSDLGTGKLSPGVLHIATHGFFFPDPNERKQPFSLDEPVFKMSDHPMIRSGLILAGGNHAWQNKPAIQGFEDGILTAMEISQIDLSNTELVVLSACETGLGDIQGNEGVYGLQRAFKIAGVKYIIMSLWQVPDRETAQFMTTFYRHWLEGKTTIREAFLQTQQEMKERFYNPYQWAGFVLIE